MGTNLCINYVNFLFGLIKELINYGINGTYKVLIWLYL